MGGKSKTQSESNVTQITETTSTGLQDTEGFAVAGGGDVEITQNVTDGGAVQGAFDFSEQFASSAFDFARDVVGRNAEISEGAQESTQAALATVATGGRSDIAKIDSKTIGLAVAGVVALFVLPQVFKRAA